MKDKISSIVNLLLRTSPFVVVCWKGREGSGKTSGIDIVRDAHPQVAVISFSTMLVEFLDTEECATSFSSEVIRDAREKMSERRKDIDLGLIVMAVTRAVKQVVSAGFKFIIFDGFPRTAEQAQISVSILSSSMPEAKYMVVEASCSAPIAFHRCVHIRKKSTDTPENITRAHAFFDEHREQILSIMCGLGASHVEYNTEGELEESLQNLTDALENEVESMQLEPLVA